MSHVVEMIERELGYARESLAREEKTRDQYVIEVARKRARQEADIDKVKARIRELEQALRTLTA